MRHLFIILSGNHLLSLSFPPSLLHHLALHSPFISLSYTYSFLLSSLLFLFSPLCTVPLYSNILIINKGINLISSLQSVNTSISCSKYRYSGTSYVPLLLLSPSSLLSSLLSLVSSPSLLFYSSSSSSLFTKECLSSKRRDTQVCT